MKLLYIFEIITKFMVIVYLKTIVKSCVCSLASEANLRSEQGGINFPPFVLSLPYAKKKKKKKLNFPYG